MIVVRDQLNLFGRKTEEKLSIVRYYDISCHNHEREHYQGILLIRYTTHDLRMPVESGFHLHDERITCHGECSHLHDEQGCKERFECALKDFVTFNIHFRVLCVPKQNQQVIE
uniref:Uncharacterized protein n=1 Tax=Cacopsylla melanoneura TaxID=428564 RepID=A0A8D9EYE3_9HEMI